MESRYLYFNYKGKGFLYSQASNNIFGVSGKVESYFKAGYIDADDDVLRAELHHVLNQSPNYSYLPTEKFYKNITHPEIVELLPTSEPDRGILNIVELDGQLEIINYLKSRIINENRGRVTVVIKQNIENVYSQELGRGLTGSNFHVIYYTNIDLLEKVLGTSEIKERIFVEVRLTSLEDLKRYDYLKIPRNFLLSFRLEDSNLREQLFKMLGDKIQAHFVETSTNLAKYVDIVRLLKYSFGKRYNKIFDLKNINEADRPLGCVHCWGRKICHQTRLFGIFTESPFLTQINPANCDSIRSFIERYFTLLLFYKEKKSVEMIPQHLEIGGYKLKLINP